MKRIFFVCCCIIFATATIAQTDSTKRDSVFLAPVEVRAIRVSTNAPFATTNITAKDIVKQNLGQSFPYLLSQAPSVITSSDDGIGVGYSSLRIRGSDITRTNVTFNGIPVNDPESQGVFFVNFGDLASSTSSVQIQRGVGSSTNGSGAFGASVNIYNLEQQKNASATISNAYGSFNTWKHTLQASTGILKGGFQFDTRLSKISSDGYIERAGTDLKSLQFIAGWTSGNDMTNVKFHLLTGKEKTGQAWNGIGTMYTSDDDAASIDYTQQLDIQGRRTNTLGKINDSTYYNDQTDNYQQDYYQFFINQKINTNWTGNVGLFLTRGRGYYNEYRNKDQFSDYFLPPSVIIGDSVITETNLTRQLWLNNYYYGGVFSLHYNTTTTDINLGGAYTKYDAKHYGFVKWAEVGIPLDYKWYDLTAFKKDFNLYGKIQQQIVTALYGFVDLQVRAVNYNLNGYRKDTTLISQNPYTFFNPKLGLTYVIKHSGLSQSKLFSSWAVANREPNRDDFEAGLATRPKHETLNDFEVGYQFSSPKFDAGITGYYMKYKNQLVLTGKINDVGAYARTNVNDSYRAGLELTAGIRPISWFECVANGTFSRNKIKMITQYADDYDNGGQIEQNFRNTDISFSPNVIAAVTATFKLLKIGGSTHNLFFDVLGKYTGRQFLDNSSNKFRGINPYTITDVRLRYDANTGIFKNLGVFVMVNNLLNKKYENNGYTYSYMYGGVTTTENYYYPQAGTNWNIGLTVSF